MVNTELGRHPSFVAWYRNPPKPMASSLRVAPSGLPGHLPARRRHLGGVDHRPARRPPGRRQAKLGGLADYAERFDNRFLRIESIAKTTSGQLRSFDLRDAMVRRAVRDFEGGKVTTLYESEVAKDYA